jgi:hypothetical protein
LNAPRLQAYGKVLSSAGNSLKEILTNINTMHGHIKMGYFSEVCTPPFFFATLSPRPTIMCSSRTVGLQHLFLFYLH